MEMHSRTIFTLSPCAHLQAFWNNCSMRRRIALCTMKQLSWNYSSSFLNSCIVARAFLPINSPKLTSWDLTFLQFLNSLHEYFHASVTGWHWLGSVPPKPTRIPRPCPALSQHVTMKIHKYLQITSTSMSVAPRFQLAVQFWTHPSMATTKPWDLSPACLVSHSS